MPKVLSRMVGLVGSDCALLYAILALCGMLAESKLTSKDEVDKIIEEDITNKLSEDLLQSIERKFQVDLERSVDMVLIKIKLLLQNGTTHIQDSLTELQSMLDLMKKYKGEETVDTCLKSRQNETSAMAEKALHQMVVCGYALIGHDPGRAVIRVVDLKNMIKQGVQPIHANRKEVDALLKVCGHEHDSLKNVVKCVISKERLISEETVHLMLSDPVTYGHPQHLKSCVCVASLGNWIKQSPIIKTSMMDITGKLIEGIVELTKLMAHGAMHEACLIEVVKTLEDDAFELVKNVKDCVYGNYSYFDEVKKYIADNNATVLDIEKVTEANVEVKNNVSDDAEMQELMRRMMRQRQKKIGMKLDKTDMTLNDIV